MEETMKSYNKQQRAKARRKTALNNLQEQLRSGTKTCKKSPTKKIPLTDDDKVRIEEEISILQTRL